MNSDINKILQNIKTAEDIKPGLLPGYLIPKLIGFHNLLIFPFDNNLIGSLCYYLRLSSHFYEPTKSKKPLNSLKRASTKRFLLTQSFDYYILKPKKSIVVQTTERIRISKDLAIKVGLNPEFKKEFLGCTSSVLTHPEGGYIKPIRFSICLTNFGERPVKLVPGSPLFQMFIEKLPYPVL